jgi:hypothetical protein
MSSAPVHSVLLGDVEFGVVIVTIVAVITAAGLTSYPEFDRILLSILS